MKNVREEYFEYLHKLVCDGIYGKNVDFTNLLRVLFEIEFRWSIPRDENRAEDGIGLRYRFSVDRGYSYDHVCDYIYGPCSVLEMMIALALRCEENIMDNALLGNRTTQWFWGMVNNLGLGGMYGRNFNERKIRNIVSTFLDRDYAPNGKGGLFTIRGCRDDLREVEIWCQLTWYLDSID